MSTRATTIYERNGYFERVLEPGDDVSSPHVYTKTDGDLKTDYIKFDTIVCYVQNVSIDSYSFQENNPVWYVNLYVLSNWQLRKIRVRLFTSVGMGIMDRLENVAVQKELEIRIGHKEENGRIKSFIWMNQAGNRVAKLYTKSNPGNKPQWKQMELPTGQTIYDKTDQLNFYRKIAETLSSQFKMMRITSKDNEAGHVQR